MHTSDIAAPPLLTQLVTQHQAQWVDFDNIAQWREHQQGDQVLLFAGDPVRFPEALDVAVVLPELRRACASAGRSFGIAVAVPACAEALDLFFGFLGSVTGNLALTLGARGGVFIGGGIVPRVLPELERSAFRERFEAKGRFRDYLRAMPIWVIQAEVSPALAGVARALDPA